MLHGKNTAVTMMDPNAITLILGPTNMNAQIIKIALRILVIDVNIELTSNRFFIKKQFPKVVPARQIKKLDNVHMKAHLTS